MPIPPDIDAYWDSTLARTAKEPLDATIEKVADPQPYFTYRVTYRSFGGARVTALLGMPIEGEEPTRKFGAIVTGPGYGGWEFGQTLSESQRGYIMLQVFPREQGESAGKKNGEPRDNPPYMHRRIENKENYFYQGAYMDMVRGIDYLLTRDDVDPNRIGVMGTSQGGGLALAMGALDKRIKAIVAHVPFLCDIRNNKAPHYEGLRTPEKLAVLDYIDPANLTHRITAPTLLSSGGVDVACPPETIRTVFDRLTCIKSLAHYPKLIHTSCGDFYDMSWAWMKRYV